MTPRGARDAIGRILAQHRSTDGHVTAQMIADAWTLYDRIRRPVLDRLRQHDNVHCCEDCGLPTCYAIGSYWLAPDALWQRVIDTTTVVLCPACFHDRAQAAGFAVSWRAVVDHEIPEFFRGDTQAIPDPKMARTAPPRRAPRKLPPSVEPPQLPRNDR